MTKHSTWECPFAPMDPRIAAVASAWFHLPASFEDRATSTMPTGLLVGEQPSPSSNPLLPMWPYPPGSAGGRLYAMSGMEVPDYLVRLARVNLARRPVARWDYQRAEHRTHQLLATLPHETRVVLCGARARDSVPATAGSEWFSQHVVPVTNGFIAAVPIPHPSGRSREYDDLAARTNAGLTVRWAAGVLETTSEGVTEHA